MKNHRFKFFICSPGIIRKQVQIFSVPYEGTCELPLCRPLENQLVLAKSCTIVPMADYRKLLDNPDVLKLKIFAGERSFILYEDSGEGYGYT